MAIFLPAVLLLLGTTSSLASTYPLANILPQEAADALAKQKIQTSEELLEKGALPRGRQKLAKATSLPLKQITEWVYLCDLLRIKGVGPVMVKLLGTAGVSSVAQLKQRQPAPLYKNVMKANEKAKITKNPPSEKHLEHWIEQAKNLKVVIR